MPKKYTLDLFAPPPPPPSPAPHGTSFLSPLLSSAQHVRLPATIPPSPSPLSDISCPLVRDILPPPPPVRMKILR